ncbi:MAG: DEAD/DEAH box helicase [Halobacteriota archaeon]
MVDFEKLLDKEKLTLSIDPLTIFEDLDQESSKEYLRPEQKSILQEWHGKLRNKKDIIVKLHTGQGKTLIGLLMLQSSINEGKGPAVYICPNNYLVTQTIEQAQSFGIKTVQFTDTAPPRSFLNSQAILVTNCKKLFNGKSVFGVAGSGREPIHLGVVVMDDAHKCLDIIRESFSVIAKRENSDGTINPLYKDLLTLFKESLKKQEQGTYMDISDGKDCFMAVPFWNWYERRQEVLNVLRKYKEGEELRFVWDLLKNKIGHCMCLISGKKLEIAPRLLPIDLISSFAQAKRRIFLSATLTEDAFLVRDLGIESESVSNPLSYKKTKYSGERLILIPTLVDTSLERERIISWLSELAATNGNFGVVSVVPSFYHAMDWRKFRAEVTDVKQLYQKIECLKTSVKAKDAKKVLVLVNEYDGVDLPDSTCRILCLDSLPSYISLADKYAQDVRPDSKVVRRQLAQRVEQGIGRAIRGSSDWCIVVIAGNNLTDFLSENAKRAYLSNEAQIQVKIGEELASVMRTEGEQLSVIEKLINQCLNRDAGWKEFYKSRMAKVVTKEPSKDYLDRALLEREAEALYQKGHVQNAVDKLQELIAISDQTDKGWFLQLKATYLYPTNTTTSMDAQLKAFTENERLFRPPLGISYSKLSSKGTNRASLILEWIRKHDLPNATIIQVNSIKEKLAFGLPSDLFEEGVKEFGVVLGFLSDRPEKLTRSGPDNLWRIEGKNYWIIECKSGVHEDRSEISKTEANQMSSSIGWFKENYEGDVGLPVFVHPANVLAKDAFVEQSWTLQPDALEKLKTNVSSFYNSLKGISSDSLSLDVIKQKLKEHHLDKDDLIKHYLKRVERKVTK